MTALPQKLTVIAGTTSGWTAPTRLLDAVEAASVEIRGVDGQSIGILKTIDGWGVLVDRPLLSAVYVPFEAIATVRDKQLMLTVAANQVDGLNWPYPLPGSAMIASGRVRATTPLPRAREELLTHAPTPARSKLIHIIGERRGQE